MLKSISREKRIKSKTNFMHDDDEIRDEVDDPKKLPPLIDDDDLVDGVEGEVEGEEEDRGEDEEEDE